MKSNENEIKMKSKWNQSKSDMSIFKEKSMLPQVVSNSSGSKAADLTVALQADASLRIRCWLKF